jgi:Domain of unknown function (DUF4111)
LTPTGIVTYLDEVVGRLQAQLGERLAGAWLVGSAALGDFDPVRSDLDVQAAATARLERPELEHLAAVLSHPALRCPVRGLEFVLYARQDAPAFQLNLNTGPGMEQHAGYDPLAEPRFWFVLDLAIAHEHARVLAGRGPAQLLAEPSPAEVIEALRDSLAWFRARDPAAAVIAGCRAWAWADEGRWLSKRDAAAWASTRLSDPAPVAKAVAHRADRASAKPTARDVAVVLERAERSFSEATLRSRTGTPAIDTRGANVE